MSSRALRARAAQACVDTYLGKPQKMGSADCVCLSRKSLHVQGVSVSIMKGERYRSLPDAVRTLKKLGFDTLIEALDAVDGLHRIPPAMAWPGDIFAMPVPDTDPFGCALAVYLGNGKAIGWGGVSNTAGIVKPHMGEALAAWRVIHG